jgi:transcription elongation factor Elf1
MSVTQDPPKPDGKIIVVCDNCGNKYRVEVPHFTTPYDRSVWMEKIRLCKDCTQLNVEPTKIEIMKDPNAKGTKWNPLEHGEGYLSQDVSAEQLAEMEKKSIEVRRSNRKTTNARIKEEFGS